MKRVVIIGSGNLAEALARAVAKSGLELVQIFARNAERARRSRTRRHRMGDASRPGWPKPTST